jgi:hypothetical protein
MTSDSFSQRRRRAAILCFLSALLCVALPGCGGCWNSDPSTQQDGKDEQDDAKSKDKRKQKKPVEDFTFGRILVQPTEVTKSRTEVNYVKRGHWVSAGQMMRANNFDVNAELRSSTADSTGTPFDIEHTNYVMSYSRPAALPKGQAKQFDSLFFVPRERTDARPPLFRNEVIPDRGRLAQLAETSPMSSMDEWQYLFVVLSSRPSAFNILSPEEKSLPTITPPTDSWNNAGDPAIRYYTVLKPPVGARLPLPTNSLAWTSIAVLLWDDLDPARLDSAQQEAMLDWLHWGGHLLISGPNSLDRLKGSFLEPFLPATNRESINLTQASFQPINDYWSLRLAKKPMLERNLNLVKEIAGVALELTDRGEFVEHTGDLVAAGRVGRGRIVVTSFSLASGALQTWKNFDGFLNGALLLRPSREFERTDLQGVAGYTTSWADRELKPFRRDARLVCGLRYFTRDTRLPEGEENAHPYRDLSIVKADATFENAGGGVESTALKSGPPENERFGGYCAVPKAGVASWNDFNGVVNVARQHLNEAAGVTIPKVDFVVKVLGVYLLVLVPLNWGLFRLMGRVEWAWLAAPVIAIVGAITVVRLAQLDIGFVRSRTEIDVVELQAGYERAHVTRFIALYTSLATGYDLTFADPTAVAQPLALSADYTRPPFTTPSEVLFRQDTTLRFSGFKVASNSTGLVHAEQMRNVGGTLRLDGDESKGWRLSNGTDLELLDVGIVRRTLDGQIAVAYLPALAAGGSTAIKFRPSESTWIDEWNQSSTMSTEPLTTEQGAQLRLGRFAELAVRELYLPPGGARLVAWSPKEADGITYAPDAPQVNGLTFVLAHLSLGRLPTVERDKNVLQDVELKNQYATPDDEKSPEDETSPMPAETSTP